MERKGRRYGPRRVRFSGYPEGVSGGSAAHIARHAAPAPAAPAPDTGPAAAGSSSLHAALPAPTAATTGFTATAPRAAGERAILRPSRGRARTNTLRRQADASSPQSATTPQRTSAVKDAVATSPGAAIRAFLRLGGWGAVPLAATVAAAAGVRARKRMRAEEVNALRGGMEQWRHTGSVAGAPPANSESDEGCEPERGTYLVIPQRAKVPSRARATGAGSKAAGSAPTGTGTASAGESKRLRASVEAGGDHSVGKGALDRRAAAGTSMYAHPRRRQWHHASTEDVHRFREKENQRLLAGRQRDDAQQQAWDRQALLVCRRETGMTRAAVEEAVMQGPRIEVGLVSSNLKVRGRRGVMLVAAAAALRSKPSALPTGARLTNGGASEQRAGVHPAAAGSTSMGGEAMDCDDDGRNCVGVGDAGMHRGDKRVRGWGDGGGVDGRDDRVMRCDGPSGVARRTREDDAPT